MRIFRSVNLRLRPGRKLPSMAPERDRPTSLEDWLEAGFALLAEGGPNALRIGRVCQRLSVTKGSFYWHFSDIQAYRAALVDTWGELRDEDRARFISMDGKPRDRLAIMMSALVDPAHWAVERVMRVWALTDERVALSVRRSDVRVLKAVHQAFVDEGFDQHEAAMRSAFLFAAGIGLLHAQDPERDAPETLREHLLDFMLRP
jgi:AcrR family transcriptional regulator